MSSTELAPMQNFQDKIVEKLRKDIGELLPEDALQKLIEKAIEDTFFKERQVVDNSGWSSKTKFVKSWFMEEVEKQIQPILEKEVKELVSKNEDVIKTAISNYITDERLTMLANAALVIQLQNTMSSSMYEFANSIADKVRNGY